MKKNKKLILGTSLLTVLTQIQTISAVETTVSDGGELMAFLNTVTNIVLPILMLATALALGISWLSWAGKDEEEKAARPFTKTLRMYIIGLGGLVVGFIILKMVKFG